MPQKKVVRYLDVHPDFKLNYNEHVKLQIDKAQKAFIANKRIFYSKDLDKEVKLLCYKLRPILNYGCSIWFNISASTMEKIRLFERKCLRACIIMYKTSESNFTKTISSYRLCKEARVTRIDLFLLKIIRNHWANIPNIHSNSLILHSIYPNPQYYERNKQDTRHRNHLYI